MTASSGARDALVVCVLAGAFAARAELTIRTSYVGGSRFDAATSIAVDAAGYIYVAGWTESADMPVVNAFQSRSGGGVDAFIAKFAPGRQSLVYLSYLGGSSYDRALAVAVDGSGNAYITGETTSQDLPAVIPHQRRSGGGKDAFVAKVGPGGALLYNTYLGGSGPDVANGIAVDATGSVYIAGETDSADFPLQGAAQSRFGGVQDAFIAKLNSTGALTLSTFLGGSLSDSAAALAVDASGGVYLTGRTESRDFPVVAAFQPSMGGGMDAFVAKLSATGSNFVFSSYLGGPTGSFAKVPECGTAIAVGLDESVYVAGVTGAGFPVAGTNTSASGGEDGFVAKIASGGSPVVYAGYVGGRSADFPMDVAVNEFGQLWVAGFTGSTDFLPPSAPRIGYAGFVVSVEPNGRITNKFAIGAEGPDVAASLALHSGSIYVAGQTASPSLPSAGPVGSRLSGLTDGFVAVLSASDAAPAPLRFVPVMPCRVMDTRAGTGAFAGPVLLPNSTRDVAISDGPCGIPRTAKAYSLNVAVVPPGPLMFLTVWPAGQARPVVATLNSDGRIKSTAAIVGAGTDGAISFFSTDLTELVLDINGYFVAADEPAGLAFYALTPSCRVADTRAATDPLGGPALTGGGTRTFPILAANCGIPSTARAYSFSFAALPKQPLWVTAWPSGQPRPNIASLNAARLTATANAAIVPAGANGSVDIFTSGETELVIDINGYFAPPGHGGLSFHAVTPCRVLDTRAEPGALPFNGVLDVLVGSTPCNPSFAAHGFVFNAVAVPPAPVMFMTLWPYGLARPGTSTLNAMDGAITGNMAIVPAPGGSMSVFASNSTHLVLDLFGYWAP